MPGRGKLKSLAFPVMAPVSAITADGERCQLYDRIDSFQKLPIVADDDRALAPAGEKFDHCRPPVPVEIVGRLVEDQEIRCVIDLGSQCGTGALAAGKPSERRRQRNGEDETRKRRFDSRLQHPVVIGQFLERCVPA